MHNLPPEPPMPREQATDTASRAAEGTGGDRATLPSDTQMSRTRRPSGFNGSASTPC